MCLAVAFELSIFLASWHTLVVENSSRSMLPSFIVLENKFHIFQKKPKDISTKYLGCLWGVSGKIDLSLYSIIPLIYTSYTLPKACQEIKVGPCFICLGFAELFKMIPDCIQAKVFFWQAPGHTVVHTEVPTPSYYLLALLAFWECCKLTF